MKKKIVFGLLFATIFLLSSSFLMSGVQASPDTETSSVMEAPTVDGVIEEGEWNDADWHNIPFYLDVNNSDGNVDGFNYLSVGEDEDNIYLSLDLCSDRTNDKNGEWLGLWLNTNETEYNNDDQWSEKINNGTESIVYDVDNEEEYPLFESNEYDSQTRNPDDEEIELTYGIQEGDEINLRGYPSYFGYGTFNLTSTDEWLGTDQTFLCNFTIDMNQFFTSVNPFFLDEYKDHIQDIEIITSSKINETNVESFELILKTNGSDASVWNPNNRFDLPLNTNFQSTIIPYGMGNLTDDWQMHFLVYGKNESDTGVFKAMFREIEIRLNVSEWADIPVIAHTSINNYNIQYSYGSSENCNEDHRMFEISINKDNIELYNAEDKLGIFLAGYGTMALINTNYWFYGSTGSYLDPYKSEFYIYLDMKGDESIPDEKNPWEALWGNIAVIIAAVVASIVAIFALIGLGIAVRRKRRLNACACDPSDPDCDCDF